MFDTVLSAIKKVVPKNVFRALQPAYHYTLSLLGALIYRFPSRKIKVVGVTGTKGKSTVTELLNSILKEAGYTTALSNTLRFKIDAVSERNLHKMTMPGRLFVQRFLRRAVDAGCDWAILEMTSEGVTQYRHKFIALDALIFTNLSPEHIESHGSFEKYRNAKRELGRALEKSSKKDTVVVANAHDEEGGWYLGLSVPKSISFSLKNAEPYEQLEFGHSFTFRNTLIHLKLPGMFNLLNALAAARFAEALGITPEAIKSGIEKVDSVPGRVEFVQREPFAVVVDYAHTPDSLAQFYSVFEGRQNICVLGNTGGGRDTWKRPKMAELADIHCNHIILTNEDPYDEDPEKIVREMANAITNTKKLEIIMDRRQAIAHALELAGPDDAVLITGKGTDPYIMTAGGEKISWDDKTVAEEELEKFARRE